MSKPEYRPDDFDDISCEEMYPDEDYQYGQDRLDEEILDGWEEDEEDMRRAEDREADRLSSFGYVDDDTPF